MPTASAAPSAPSPVLLTTPRRSLRRGLGALLVTLAVLTGVFAVSASPAQAVPSNTQELQFLTLLNQLRGSYGLPSLSWDDGIADSARSWSGYMASINGLQHDPNLAGVMNILVPGWTRAGENVGVGYDVQGLHNAFVASPGHFANMVGDYNRVGIGVVGSGGKLWVTVRFAKAPSDGWGSSPTGNFDGATQTGEGTVAVSGWALDPDTTGAIDVHLYVNGAWAGMALASGNRPDVGAAYPQYGPYHGWSTSLSGLGPGTFTLCAYGINAANTPGYNPALACRSVTVRRLGSPFGSIDGVSQSGPGQLSVAGWAIDPDTSASVTVDVLVDGVVRGSGTANTSRPDVGIAYPGAGNNHGYAVTATGVLGGSHTVCVRANNASGTSGSAQVIGCRSVWLPPDPRGSLDAAASPAKGKLRVSGWTLDPDVAGAIAVHVYVDGNWGGLATANQNRPDIGTAFPGWGSNHGYTVDLSVGAGVHTVCTYGINASGTPGVNPQLGCRAVTVG